MRFVRWRDEHEAWLRYALTRFLEAGIERGGDLLPTERNVSALLGLGLEGAKEGDPCLIAVHRHVPIAFVLWVGVDAGMDLRWKTIQALGSYTEPKHRRSGVAQDLRDYARYIAVRAGYERVVGMVHTMNTRGAEHFIEKGAWPTATQFEIHAPSIQDWARLAIRFDKWQLR